MPTRNVVLTDHQSRMIDQLVHEGAYQNASEVLRDGLRMVEASRERHAAKLGALRALVDEADKDIANGRSLSLRNGDEIDALLTSLRAGRPA